MSLYPHLSLSHQHTLITHIPSSSVLLVDSLIVFCSVDRAIEKIVRSYKNNISVVCDVVRQMVVFDSMPDMVSMLRAMTADPHIKIMRIKNRMSSGLKLCNALQFAEHFIISITNAFIPQTFYEKSWRNAILKQTFEFECVLSAYNSSATCGYRDVLVNMCFENDITTREFFERVSSLCLCRVAIYVSWYMHVACV
jgi:hypothetical protein